MAKSAAIVEFEQNEIASIKSVYSARCIVNIMMRMNLKKWSFKTYEKICERINI